jgi:hypothetical protein
MTKNIKLRTMPSGESYIKLDDLSDFCDVSQATHYSIERRDNGIAITLYDKDQCVIGKAEGFDENHE